jgi:hypothetical protein
MGASKTNGRGKVRVKFCEYSANREYVLQPDIVEYDENEMTKPGFDLVCGNTLKELGIVLDFWTKEITLDDISLPMGDINKLKSRATIKACPRNHRTCLRPLSASCKSYMLNMKKQISGQLLKMIATNTSVPQNKHHCWSSCKSLTSCMTRH